MSPGEVETGDCFWFKAFRKHRYAGSKIIIKKKFGVDFLAYIPHLDKDHLVFYYEIEQQTSSESQRGLNENERERGLKNEV